MFQIALLTIFFSLFSLSQPAFGQEGGMSRPVMNQPELLRSNLGEAGVHGTTRGHQRKIAYVKGAWVIAYSNDQGSHLRLSRDGLQWMEPLTFHYFDSSSSFTLVSWKQRLFLFYTDFQPEREYKGDGVVVREVVVRDDGLELKGEAQPVLIDPQGTDFYISAAVGSDGTFWVQSRHLDRSLPDGEIARDTRLTRTVAPEDLSEWTEPVVPIPIPGKGSIVPLIVPLPDGKAYTFGRTYQDLWKKLDPNPAANQLLGGLFDGTRWSEQPSVLAPRMTHIMGDDRRMSAVLDDKTGIVHLLYIDAGSVLRHRQLHPPYEEGNWQPLLSQPGAEVHPGPVHCAVVGLDPHVTPSRVYLVFGRELRVGDDPRERTGELRLAAFDGSTWRIEPQPVSEPGADDCWYPNVAAEVTRAGQLGLLYLKGKSGNRLVLLRVRPAKE